MDDDSSRDRTRALELENAALRARLAELNAGPLSLGISHREALLVEAERVARMGSWAWDLITGEIQWSDELYRILGYEPDTVRPSTEAFFAAIHPEDRLRVQEGAGRGLNAASPEKVAFRVVRPDGSVRHVQMEGAPLAGPHGAHTHVVGAVIDLTESIQSSALLSRTVEELRTAQRLAHMGSYVLEVPSMRTTWSAGMYELLQIDEAVIPSPELFFKCVHPEDRVRAFDETSRMLATGVGQITQLRMQREDGTIWYAVAESMTQHDAEGRLVGSTGIVQDVTRRRAEEERLRSSEKMAAVGTLAGGIAHDFNNYLTVLMGEAELLRRTLVREHGSLRELDAIHTASDRCAKLVSQLLTLSRKRRTHPERFEVGALLSRLSPMLQSVLGECNELLLHTEEAPLFVRADPTEIEHALINLAVNARDAMTHGGTFMLSLDRVANDRTVGSGTDNTPLVRLLASDTGEGIEPEFLARIFEPFFTTKGVGKGTGLGLATVYSVMEQAGGSIDVQSEVGRGTTFRIYLPLDEASDSVQATQQPDDVVNLGAGKMVLVVEDVEEVRRVIRDQLLAAGYRVQTAAHGLAALDLLAKTNEPVDLVLSDVVMPVLGGFELERRLRERHPQVLCLLMTGYDASGSNVPESRIALRKPFTGKELLMVLNVVWRQESGIPAPRSELAAMSVPTQTPIARRRH